MKLSKNIETRVFEVLANYRVKTNNAPFIAILKLAVENGGEIYAELLQQKLLNPLTEIACLNLLNRLCDMGYFNEGDEYYDIFNITDIGRELAEKEIFFEQRTGLLKIYLVEDNEFIEQKIIRIEELRKDANDTDEKVRSNISVLKSIQNSNKIIELNNNSFIIDEIEKYQKEYKQQFINFVFNVKNDSSEGIALDYAMKYREGEGVIKDMILKNEYARYYDESTKLLKTNFDKENLNFNRTISIEEPLIYNTRFNYVNIENVKVSPKRISDAKEWFFELLKKQIDKYFLSEEEFTNYANEIAKQFPEFFDKLENLVDTTQFIKLLHPVSDFYTIAKLETINYLNY